MAYPPPSQKCAPPEVMQAHIYWMVPDHTGPSSRDICLYIREVKAWLPPHALESAFTVSF